MSDDEKPLFLQANKPETWGKPEDTTWGDHFIKPGKPLSARHRTLARMLAKGCTTTEIAEKLGYTVSRVSILKSNTEIQKEVERCLDRMHEDDLETRMKELAPDAIGAIEEILRDETLDATKKENAARWLLEKLTGKASQQINISGEVSVGMFLDKLDQLQAAGKVLDVTPTDALPVAPTEESAKESGENLAETQDEMDLWIKENLK